MTKWVVLLLVSLGTSVSWGWGRVGHEMVAAGAARLAGQGQLFWQANEKTLAHLAVVPDRIWKLPATYNQEKHTHYFQADG